MLSSPESEKNRVVQNTGFKRVTNIRIAMPFLKVLKSDRIADLL